uniref:Uncharacterized protein n=2 Tax=Planktothrix pseudagardhii TaxID=132604 RepID=A0A9W4CGM0_9CYAN|nr:hypothetical protein NO713_01089 [Planktothrix pseudagardhii]
MLPSGHRPPQPTDDEARRRLKGLRTWAHGRYGNQLAGDFNQDWPDVLQEAQTEVLTKIDIYKKGVDFELYNLWYVLSEIQFLKTNPNLQNQKFIQHRKELCIRFKKVKIKSVNFCEACCNQKVNNNADLLGVWDTCYNDIQQGFPEEVAKFRNRFIQRRTKKKDGIIIRPYPPEKAQQLSQICENFCNSIQTNEIDLQQVWNTFCEQVQQLFQPRSFWNWFERYIKFRFFDIIRERQRVILNDGQNPPPAPPLPPPPPPNPLPQIISEDQDGIFTNKHIRNFPEENFRIIAILKMGGATLKDLDDYFKHPIDPKKSYAQQTISPFYSRCVKYFTPIFKEYIEECNTEFKLALDSMTVEQIIDDEQGKFKNERLRKTDINFQQIILMQQERPRPWRDLAQELKIDVKDLIYFYLDCISYFQLAT